MRTKFATFVVVGTTPCAPVSANFETPVAKEPSTDKCLVQNCAKNEYVGKTPDLKKSRSIPRPAAARCAANTLRMIVFDSPYRGKGQFPNTTQTASAAIGATRAVCSTFLYTPRTTLRRAPRRAKRSRRDLDRETVNELNFDGVERGPRFAVFSSGDASYASYVSYPSSPSCPSPPAVVSPTSPNSRAYFVTAL